MYVSATSEPRQQTPSVAPTGNQGAPRFPLVRPRWSLRSLPMSRIGLELDRPSMFTSRKNKRRTSRCLLTMTPEEIPANQRGTRSNARLSTPLSFRRVPRARAACCALLMPRKSGSGEKGAVPGDGSLVVHGQVESTSGVVDLVLPAGGSGDRVHLTPLFLASASGPACCATEPRPCLSYWLYADRQTKQPASKNEAVSSGHPCTPFLGAVPMPTAIDKKQPVEVGSGHPRYTASLRAACGSGCLLHPGPRTLPFNDQHPREQPGRQAGDDSGSGALRVLPQFCFAVRSDGGEADSVDRVRSDGIRGSVEGGDEQ